MPAYDNTYSRVVSWLKVLLPLLALAILSTLFLVARTIDPAQDLPMSDVDLDALTREPRIGKPTFSGMTAGGAAFSLSAERAVPDAKDPGRVTGEDVRAALDLPGGIGVDIRADGGRIDNTAKTAGLDGNVQVKSTNGYLLESDDLNVAFQEMRLWSDGGVTMSGPGMQLSAGQFEATGGDAGKGPYVLVFKGKVKLLYDPKG